MKKISKALCFSALLVAVAAICLPAGAQTGQDGERGARQGRRGQRGGRGAGGVSAMFNYMRNVKVQEELQLSDEQGTQLDALSQEVGGQGGRRGGGRGNFGGGGAGGGGEEGDGGGQRRDFREAARERDAKIAQGLSDILFGDQLKRLEGITIQAQGPSALLIPSIQQRLGLSPQQKESLGGVTEEFGTKRRELFAELGGGNPRGGGGGGGGGFGAGREKMAELTQGQNDALLAVLNESQAAQMEEMKGEPFEGIEGLRRAGRGGRGGRGRGGPGGPGGGEN